MKTRILSALVFIPIVLAALAKGGATWNLGVAALAAIAGYEMEAMFARAGHRPMRALAPVGAAVTVTMAGFFGAGAIAPALAAVVVAAFLDQLRRQDAERSLTDWALGMSATVYVGLMLSYLAMLRGLPSGAFWTITLLVLVWANDSAAYLGGRMFGRVALAPTISPKKTREGFAAGMAASVIAGGALWAAYMEVNPPPVFYSDPPPWTPYPMLGALVLLGAAVSVAGPTGDLCKSFIKRQIGVKDSGTLIPGHGGVLDRMDSLMFASPVVYLALIAMRTLVAISVAE